MQTQVEIDEQTQAPESFIGRMKRIGPGFVAAATGVGTGDLVAALVAGTGYGLTFIWAIIVGAILKHFLNEGVGRWNLGSGKTILEGWRSLGKWTTIYFGIYIVIWGFVYGAAATSASAMAMNAMVPGLPIWAWAMIHGVIGFTLIWFGHYGFFEKMMMVLIGVMFITVIGSALIFLPSLGDIFTGLVPTIPDGSLMLALGLVGGVGGTITMASYGYWLKEKGWKGGSWIKTMRLDSKVAYFVTTLFTLALLIVGSQFLFGTGISINGDKGLVTLADKMGNEFTPVLRWLFLIGFWSAAFSSLLGVWNGIPYLFADFVRHFYKSEEKRNKPVTDDDPAYRVYLCWLTFPPMLLLLFGKPVELIILYGALGALFMPFLSGTLLWLLNSTRIESTYRSNWLSNTILTLCILLFGFLAVHSLIQTF
ncbi:Nramp family divalent metal transporter [Pontibacillus salicampi]|uniref:Nramp family divalent metal transporter n=1 Tax=Pontibacillus salicampi TaxID=1449801 RepID=A0ABV6LUG0_9BACI